MTSSIKLIGFCFAVSLAAFPAAAQVDTVGAGKRELATLRQQEADVRQRIGQLQLDALIERVGRTVTRRAAATAARPIPQSVARWTIADLYY